MNKYLKYLLAAISFLLAAATFYITYTVTEFRDTMRDFEAGNMGQSPSFDVQGMLLSAVGIILVILFVCVGYKSIQSARKP